MAQLQRWKDHSLLNFQPEGDIPTFEEWRTWGLSTFDKLDAMNEEWFSEAADSLILIDDEFHHLVAHPAADVVSPAPDAAFKTAVVNLAVLHGFKSPTAADNVAPATGVRLNHNYDNIVM